MGALQILERCWYLPNNAARCLRAVLPRYMSLLTLSNGKRQRLDSLSTPSGVIEALAMDQRKSLRRMIAEAASADLEDIPDDRLAEFKSAVTQVLSEESSAILLDPEYGVEASKQRSSHCGLLLAYEMDGYENPRPCRMLALMPNQSVRRLRDLGAEGIKILLHYSPDDPPAANDEKCASLNGLEMNATHSTCLSSSSPYLMILTV